MKRTTASLVAGAVVAGGLAITVPALASTGNPSTAAAARTAAPLTSAQKDSIEQFLADHPNIAQALAGKAAGWAKFLAANPSVKTELDKVLALPADQRQAELKKWLAANPDAKKALQTYRKGLKEQRLTHQQARLQKRLDRLQGKASGSGAARSSTSSFTT